MHLKMNRFQEVWKGQGRVYYVILSQRYLRPDVVKLLPLLKLALLPSPQFTTIGKKNMPTIIYMGYLTHSLKVLCPRLPPDMRISFPGLSQYVGGFKMLKKVSRQQLLWYSLTGQQHSGQKQPPVDTALPATKLLHFQRRTFSLLLFKGTCSITLSKSLIVKVKMRVNVMILDSCIHTG